MKIKKNCLFLCLLTLVLALAACGKSQAKQEEEGEGLKIVTSFYPIYAMVKEVSGDLNDVRMIQSGEGIHSFEPSANDVAAIHDADVFVYHSRTLESWAVNIDSNLKDSKVQVVEATEGMQLERVEGLEDMEVGEGVDEKTLYDPHTWLDPIRMAEEAKIIANKLSEVDREHREIYQENAKRLAKEAQDLVGKYQPIFQEAPQKTFVTQHTAFSYLAKRFGLKQLGIAGISPEQEPSPRQLTEIEDFVKKYQIQTIFVESNASSKVADTVAQATGVRLKTLNPLEEDPENNQTYLENLTKNLENLARELKK
ncbi:metal ABC transporter solute-binding protein, Zn/Mn family [Streptococcus oricebi]|uniref:Adhesion protein n=1 Tax=Streptococcus oricebi TaxID=1547447 RepID=A0ABS5B0L0_9STRE|nr:zinc ABC transporter substrate-binding protein [Streptococcus oricebi]MBP2622363.1 adhesion protein [Streptococcus oricebi]